MKKLLPLLLFPCFANAATLTADWDYPTAEEVRITSFNIERKTGSCAAAGTFAQWAVVPKTLRTYADATVVEGSTYCYRLKAVGPGGESAAITADATVVFGVPNAPTNLRFH